MTFRRRLAFVCLGLFLAGNASCAYHRENRKEMAGAYYQQAKAHLQEGRGIEDELNRRRAYGYLMEAIRRNPDNPDYHIDLGAIYLYDRRNQEARQEFGTALELDPENPMAHQNLGQLYLATGRNEEALQEFDLALGNYNYQFPWTAHFNKGRAYYNLRRYAEAAESFTAAVSVVPGWGAAWQSLGLSLEKASRFSEAEKALRKSLELLPESVVSHYYLGLVLYKGKKLAEAKEEFRKVVALDPDGEMGKNSATYLTILR